MRQFVLIFRMDIINESARPTPEQIKEYMKDWNKWIDSISSAGKLAEGGNHLSYDGKVIRPGTKITDGPYESHNESVAGYIIVSAKDIDEAVSLAVKCPILNGEGTSVEIRQAEGPGQTDM